MNNYWIAVTFPQEETQQKLEKTLQNCQIIYDWSINAFKQYWLAYKETPHAGSISKNVTAYIAYLPMRHETQRFTLNKTVELALRHFKFDLKSSDNKIEYVPSFPEPLTDFQIATRLVWMKYMENYGQISSFYGTLHLEEEWRAILDLQAKDLKIPVQYISQLWYSTTLRYDENWKIKFNVHAPDSYQGKQAKKKAKKLWV